ncbi:tetratricopeptide repeat protein [Candidatus Riflebacteria bacterium]
MFESFFRSEKDKKIVADYKEQFESISNAKKGDCINLIKVLQLRDRIKTKDALKKLNASDYFSNLKDKNELKAIGDIFHIFITAYFIIDDFKSLEFLIPEFISFLAANPLLNKKTGVYVDVLFKILSAFSMTFFQDDKSMLQERYDYNRDEKYRYFLEEFKKFVQIKEFNQWATASYNKPVLLKWGNRFLYDLTNFLINKREELFLTMLDFLLFMRSKAPFLKEKLAFIKCIIHAAGYSYFRFNDDVFARIETIIKKYQLSNKTDYFSQELLDLCLKFGNAPFVSLKSNINNAEVPATDDEELTVAYVYEKALEAILGDENISNEETKVIQSLRSWLPIPQKDYMQIFNWVSEAKKKGEGLSLDGDFVAEDFLYEVMLKTYEDDEFSRDEKEIIYNLSQALFFTPETLNRLEEKAKKEIEEKRGNKTQSNTDKNFDKQSLIPDFAALKKEAEAYKVSKLVSERFAEIVDELEKEYILKDLLHNAEQARPAVNVSKDYFNHYNDELARQFGVEKKEDIPSGLNQLHTFTHFICAPDFSKKPFLVIFVDNAMIHSLRVQFRGERISLILSPGTINKEADLENDKKDDDFELYMFNESLESDIKHDGAILKDQNSIAEFIRQHEQAGGKYYIALVRLDTLSPFRIIEKSGYLDESGHVAAGANKMSQGNFKEAIQILQLAHSTRPLMHEILLNIGFCYKNLAAMGVEPQVNNKKAITFYKKEIELNPLSQKTFSNLGVLYKQMDRFEEAVDNLKMAIDLDPACVGTIGSYVSTYTSLAMSGGAPIEKAIKAAAKYFGLAYQLNCNHPLTQQMIQSMSEFLNLDLYKLIKLEIVDTKYQ